MPFPPRSFDAFRLEAHAHRLDVLDHAKNFDPKTSSFTPPSSLSPTAAETYLTLRGDGVGHSHALSLALLLSATPPPPSTLTS